MAGPFEIVAQKLGEMGFYNFLLPWLVTSALLWGLLKRSNFFGENSIVINSVLSISVSFFIWGFIIFTGSDVGTSLSTFFTQMIFVGLAFLLIVLLGSLLVPDFTEQLKKVLPTTSVLWIVVVIGVIMLLGAGMINIGSVIYNLIKTAGSVPGGNVGILVVAVFFLLIILTLIASN